MKEEISLLGIKWQAKSDTFRLTLPSYRWASDEQVTKRKLLSLIAGVYDPCGWISPALLGAKNAQADIWAKHPGKWDDPIPPELLKPFRAVIEDWQNAEFLLPRRTISLSITESNLIELHGFSDACDLGIGLAIYIRITDPFTGNVETALLFARSLVIPTSLRPKAKKTRIDPSLTIPRLELQALRLLCKSIEQVETHFGLKINHTVLWTDSTIVIHWLRSSELTDVFVRNRVSAMRKFPVSHLVSQDNPADIASRCTNAHVLRKSQMWWKGPSWLSTQTTSWPNSELTYKPGDELIKSESDTPFFAVDCAAALQKHTNIPLIDLTKFDRVHKAERRVHKAERDFSK